MRIHGGRRGDPLSSSTPWATSGAPNRPSRFGTPPQSILARRTRQLRRPWVMATTRHLGCDTWRCVAALCSPSRPEQILFYPATCLIAVSLSIGTHCYVVASPLCAQRSLGQSCSKKGACEHVLRLDMPETWSAMPSRLRLRLGDARRAVPPSPHLTCSDTSLRTSALAKARPQILRGPRRRRRRHPGPPRLLPGEVHRGERVLLARPCRLCASQGLTRFVVRAVARQQNHNHNHNVITINANNNNDNDSLGRSST